MKWRSAKGGRERKRIIAVGCAAALSIVPSFPASFLLSRRNPKSIPLPSPLLPALHSPPLPHSIPVFRSSHNNARKCCNRSGGGSSRSDHSVQPARALLWNYKEMRRTCSQCSFACNCSDITKNPRAVHPGISKWCKEKTSRPTPFPTLNVF